MLLDNKANFYFISELFKINLFFFNKDSMLNYNYLGNY